MSIISDRIRESSFIHGLLDDAADEIERLEEKMDYLEAQVERMAKGLESLKIPSGYILMPVNPEPETIDRAVSFALNVSLSADYTWSQYMTDLYKHMMVR